MDIEQTYPTQHKIMDCDVNLTKLVEDDISGDLYVEYEFADDVPTNLIEFDNTAMLHFALVFSKHGEYEQ